ncbi:MAG: tetratricopeptide repeat protein [Acidobacteriota bacterium]
MYRFSRTRLIWALMLLFAVQASCQTASEEDMARKVKDSTSPAEQIVAAREFLAAFPKSSRRAQVARIFFEAAVKSSDEAAAVQAAEAMLAGRTGSRLDSARNYLAWTLAENGLALDSADRFAGAMVEDARKEKSGSLSSYLDTYAYVKYREGDTAEAERLQKEALAGHDQDPEMLGRLALYQHANGRHLEALQSAASAILKGDNGEIVAAFPTWLNDDGDAEETARQIIDPAVSDFLLADDSPVRRGRAALLMAMGNIDLTRAESMAREALKASQAAGSQSTSAELEVDLAQVYCARGDYAGVVEMLSPQESTREPWDALYWYTLGRAYRLSDRPEDAAEALLEPLLVGNNRLVMPDLRELGLSDDAIQVRLQATREALESFDPGEFKGTIPAAGRTVLLELFTGAECNPCQAADLAVDLMSEYFPRTALAVLEYHVHIPGADPLTTPDSVARYQYYDVHGTPTVLFNGDHTLSGGGPGILKKSLFEQYRDRVETLWTQAPDVAIDASAQPEQGEVHVVVRVTPADPAGKVPEGVIRVALVEKSVDYTGGNGIGPQAFVVRDLSEVEETGAKLVDGSAFLDYTISLKKVEATLGTYLDDFEKNPPERYKGFGGFREKPIALNAGNLAVVVWVENRDTKTILQSVYLPL